MTWSYDDALRVEIETVVGQVGSSAQIGSFAYDADGLVTQSGPLSIVRSPTSGAIESTTVTSGANTIVETREYHPDTGLLDFIQYVRNGTTTLYEATLERDELGRVWRKTETVLGTTKVLVYEYDLAGRLKQVTSNGVVTELYGYDANGNRTSVQNSGGSKTATYDAQDRMLTYGSATYMWTSFGNLSSRTSPRLLPTYNAFGDVTFAETTTGTSFSYLTDALGRRIRKASGSTVLGKWLWRNELAPVAELNASDVLTRRYFYADAPNAPEVVVTPAGAVWRLIKDDVGSVRLVMNLASSTPLRRLDYDAFGRVTAQTGTANIVPFGFAGGFWDPDTKLVRFGARDYDPETGRWLSKDPALFGGGLNFYVYANNDPVNFVDPAGNVPVPVIIIGASAFASVFFADNAEAAYDAAIAQFVGLGVGHVVGRVASTALGRVCSYRTVTSWADAGTTPDLNPGRWVQLGSRTRWNYLKTGLPGGKFDKQPRPPFFSGEANQTTFSNAITSEVRRSSLAFPWDEPLGGLVGQRRLVGPP